MEEELPTARATKMHNFNILPPPLSPAAKHANFQPILNLFQRFSFSQYYLIRMIIGPFSCTTSVIRPGKTSTILNGLSGLIFLQVKVIQNSGTLVMRGITKFSKLNKVRLKSPFNPEICLTLETVEYPSRTPRLSNTSEFGCKVTEPVC